MKFAKTVFVGILLACPALASGQTSGCMPADSTSEILLARITRVTTVSDFQAERQAYELPVLEVSDVALVAADSVCAIASDAINAASGIVETRQVHVVRAGSVYVVMDPAILVGDRRLMWIFDASWGCLAAVAI